MCTRWLVAGIASSVRTTSGSTARKPTHRRDSHDRRPVYSRVNANQAIGRKQMPRYLMSPHICLLAISELFTSRA